MVYILFLFIYYFNYQEAVTLRLSSHQISLLLSSIWAQSISPENTPENYEAIAHTYSLVLLFSRAKVISYVVNYKENWVICDPSCTSLVFINVFGQRVFWVIPT